MVYCTKGLSTSSGLVSLSHCPSTKERSMKLLVLHSYQVQYKPRLRNEVAALDGFRLEWDDVMEAEQLIMSQRLCRTTDHHLSTTSPRSSSYGNGLLIVRVYE